MICHRFTITFIVTAALVVLTGFCGTPAQAVEPAAASATPAVAAGSVEDSLKVCLARIPKDATPGQKMIAEQGCDRDQIERKAIQSVPGQ